jgi:nucleoside-diphosphate-sugar epimerase
MSSGVFVLGSTGPTGELLVRDLCTAGSSVWVMHRTDKRKIEFERMGATVLTGDAMDRESVFRATEQAAAACDTVVDLIGGNPMQPADTWADCEGNVNAIDAAASADVRRFVFITSVGTGSSFQYVPEEAFTRPILELKSRAETHLRDSGLRYCIIKPGGLWHQEQVNDGDEALVTENDSVRGLIDRTQLVEVIKQVLEDDRRATDGKELYAVTYKIEVLNGDATPFEFEGNQKT